MKSEEDINSKIMTVDEIYKSTIPEELIKEINGDTNNQYFSTFEEMNSRITIDRPVYRQNISRDFQENSKSFCSSFKWHCRPKKMLKNTIPIINWVYKYNWKQWLIRDIIAGFTVAVMNIPQGMAYALLGNVPPVVGIYMAFFPVLVYIILGSSRHVSMGSFAVICLMAGNVVSKHSTYTKTLQDSNYNVTNNDFSPIEVATAVTFLVGIYQVIMYFFRLGIICTLLSETLVSGFTAGAAIHVLTSQIKDILGLKLKQINGPFKLIFVYIEIFSKLHTINIAATVISVITIVILVTNNELLKPFVEKKTIVPIPIELLVVLAGTLISTYFDIPEFYNLKTVGDIATGLPDAKVPNFNLIPLVAVDSATIAIIAYIVSFSMALIFANKLKYKVDPNQELLAQGCGNIFGSFFSCLPFSASLSRSVLQQSVGGVTQLASLVSCIILLAVLLWIGPFFEPLPRCILASLIVVALKGILLQAKDIVQIWKISHVDGLIWISTYLTVICVEIEYGLVVGVAVSVLTLILKGAKGDISLLGRVPNTEFYVDSETQPKLEFLPGIRIVRYCGCLNFLNKNYFEKQIMQYIKWQPSINENILNKINPGLEINNEAIIFDFKSLQYVDASGGKVLKNLLNNLCSNKGLIVYLVGLSDPVLKFLNSIDVLNDNPVPLMPTIHDAVTSAQKSTNKELIYSVRL